MSVVIEKATGAQLLPDIRDGRKGHWTSYDAHLACDADLRACVPTWGMRAAEIEVRRE